MSVGPHLAGAPLVTLNMYGIATTLVIYSHFFHPLASTIAGPDNSQAQNEIYGALHSISLDQINLFVIFCVLAGVEDRRHNWEWSRISGRYMDQFRRPLYTPLLNPSFRGAGPPPIPINTSPSPKMYMCRWYCRLKRFAQRLRGGVLPSTRGV